MPTADIPTSHEAGPLQWGARLGLVLYLVLLASAVLSPSSGGPDALLSGFADRLVARGVPTNFANVSRLEVVANVAIVVPVGALGALSYPQLRWQDWAAYAFVSALTVELVQGLFLPGREMTATDVVANTAGASIGLVVRPLIHGVCGLLRVLRRGRGLERNEMSARRAQDS